MRAPRVARESRDSFRRCRPTQVPLFNGITSDLFPGVVLPVPDRKAMQLMSGESCVERNLQLTDYFWGKIVQIYDMMVVRFVCGVLMVFSLVSRVHTRPWVVFVRFGPFVSSMASQSLDSVRTGSNLDPRHREMATIHMNTSKRGDHTRGASGGFMIVGAPFKLHAEYPNDARWTDVVPFS